MTRNEFSLLCAIRKQGLQSIRKLKALTALSTGYLSQTLKDFAERGLTDAEGITEKGLRALQPYRVENAVIMAAGLSSRFVPLSLEKPKGLLVVRNEVLIERQIEQLLAAGIREIVLVLGYKKEAFFYLEDKYPGIRIIINPEYATKNNIHTLYLARDYIRNTYICSSDDYFEENPFEEYVYQSYYSAVRVEQKTNEWYMIPDSRMNIARVQKHGEKGLIMMGHVYWDRHFSEAMLKLIVEDHETGKYEQALWEDLLMDYVRKLPPMEIREYPRDMIHEFDSLEELREFDLYYVHDTHSRIMKNITKTLSCREDDIAGFSTLKKGITNTSFLFEVREKKYVYRHPNDDAMIRVDRSREKRSLELARSIGADPTLVYMDETAGWKISAYLESARHPSPSSPEDTRRVAALLRKLHDRNLSVRWSFFPWEEAHRMEILLRSEKEGISDPGFDALRDRVARCLKSCEGDGISLCFCHCDAGADNWLLTEGGTALIDWEYAGLADPGCDLGTYILHAGWDVPRAEDFIRAYCGGDLTPERMRHFLAYTAVMAWYWYVWGLSREAGGLILGEGLYRWRTTAGKFSSCLLG